MEVGRKHENTFQWMQFTCSSTSLWVALEGGFITGAHTVASGFTRIHSKGSHICPLQLYVCCPTSDAKMYSCGTHDY